MSQETEQPQSRPPSPPIENGIPLSRPRSESAPPNTIEELPHLTRPHKKRILKVNIGLALATLDLCCLPITYYYALKFGTSLSLQDIFAVITGVYGLISFTHYSFRSLKLFRSHSSSKWRPIGWTRWGMLEFLQVNVLIVITLVEIELVAGTAPNNPIVRLCAMPSPTICFYLGFLFITSAILTQMRMRIPFNMSSTPKGTLWRPALLAFLEDAGCIEGQGGVEFRKAVMKRYEVSPRFRRLILAVTWGWGLGFIGIATVATVLIFQLPEDIGFGVGWGLPYAWAGCWTILTMLYSHHELEKERAEWAAKKLSNESTISTPLA